MRSSSCLAMITAVVNLLGWAFLRTAEVPRSAMGLWHLPVWQAPFPITLPICWSAGIGLRGWGTTGAARDLDCTDFRRLLINPEMDLAPDAPFAVSMLAGISQVPSSAHAALQIALSWSGTSGCQRHRKSATCPCCLKDQHPTSSRDRPRSSMIRGASVSRIISLVCRLIGWRCRFCSGREATTLDLLHESPSRFEQHSCLALPILFKLKIARPLCRSGRCKKSNGKPEQDQPEFHKLGSV